MVVEDPLTMHLPLGDGVRPAGGSSSEIYFCPFAKHFGEKFRKCRCL